MNAYDLHFYSSESETNVPQLVVTWSNTPKTVYFLKDHLGSTRATVDQTGAVVGYDDYDAWGYALGGRTMATQWSSLQSVAENKFTGKERDDDFGINWDYFGARYYDAQIGRWMARDPLAEKYPWLSPYTYVADNPLKFFDPNGKEIINNSKRFVAIIGDQVVGHNKVVLKYKVLAPGQRSDFIYDEKGNWTGGRDDTDYDFFNYGGEWYKAPSKSWLPPIPYWITDEWGAKHPFNLLLTDATLNELGAIREWLILAGAPKEVIKEIERLYEKKKRETQKKDNQRQGKKSKSDDKNEKQKKEEEDDNENTTDPHKGWGAENQGPPPRR